MITTTLKAVIVEDDPGHAESLQGALSKLATGIQVASVCTGIAHAYEMISLHRPELVFLDIELDRGENGFDLLKKFPDPEFSVILPRSTIRIKICCMPYGPVHWISLPKQ